MENRKKYAIVLSTLGLVLILFGVTYSFFNYTRTGFSNNIRVGRISFVSKNEETITLNNLFPIDPTETGVMDDSTKVGTYEIEIKGDTDYVNGLEYLVSTVDSNITTLPINIDINVSNGLGANNDTYWTARESKNANIYKKLAGDTIVGDQMLLVGYIKPNTTSGTEEGVDGKITIKAYIDKNKIAITDTPEENIEWQEGRTVISTEEWNTISTNGLSFKVRVEANEGIWVKGSIEEIMKKLAVMDNISSEFVSASTGIDFGAISSDTNGKGVYMRAGTENNAYPIMYYRGAVEDNNVMFANKCWKAVRTTDTGGVKLIYNGELSGFSAQLVESDYSILTNTGSMTFDAMDNAWVVHATEAIGSFSDQKEISFTVPNGDGYLLEIFGSSGSFISGQMYRGTSGTYQQNNGFGGGGGQPISASVTSFGTMAQGDSIKVTYFGTGTSEQELILKVRVIYSDETLGMGCDNHGSASQITVNNTNTFPFSGTNIYNSPAYVGYMYGTVYEYNTANWTSGARFGSGFTWDGTHYTLVDDETTTPNATHHYSCNVTTEGGTCQELRYVYYVSGSTKYYITLTGGDGIEEAFDKMNTNTNDSNAKDKIETWYASNMNTVTNKLEDTIWCNDRSFGDKNNNGWISNGGSLSTYLYYGARERSNYAQNTSTVKNQPSLACANKNDAFTWKNGAGNGALDYPVGMITEDEIVLAGGLSGSTNENFYLKSGETYWSLSPNHFVDNSAYGFVLNYNGGLGNGYVVNPFGLRPSVSLKPGQLIRSGTGTTIDPYVIE